MPCFCFSPELNEPELTLDKTVYFVGDLVTATCTVQGVFLPGDIKVTWTLEGVAFNLKTVSTSATWWPWQETVLKQSLYRSLDIEDNGKALSCQVTGSAGVGSKKQKTIIVSVKALPLEGKYWKVHVFNSWWV